MKNSKVIKILKTLSADELVSFEKFVASPYFNSVKNNIQFFKEIKKFYPDFDDDNVNSEYFYRKLFGNKPFNKQVIWNMTSGLEKLLKEFLEQTALRKNKLEKMELLSSELISRKLLSNFSNALQEMEMLLEANNIDYSYFENKINLESYKQEYNFLADKPMGRSKMTACEYKILLFLCGIAGGLNDISLDIKDFNMKFEVNLPLEFVKRIDLKSIAGYARSKNFKYSFLIDIYCHSLLLLLEPDEIEHFNKLKKLYMNHYHKFSLTGKRTIIRWLLIYCIERTDSEGMEYEKLIFQLNKFRLKEKLVYYHEGQLPKEIFYQILSVALSIDKIKWAENFFKIYAPELKPEIRDSVEAIGMSYIHFQKKEYEKVLNDINSAVYSDMWDKLLVKSVIARTYYEMRKFDSLLNHIDSSKHFLKNNTSVSELYEKFYGNFYNILIKLISVQEKGDLSTLPILKKGIQSTVKLDNKKWLIEKVAELEKVV
jgi:hypothetical protein